YPEITTVRAKIAYLTFDRPISNYFDMSKAKIVGAELRDKIEIINNRRKPRSNDELYVYVPTGPLYYQSRPESAQGAPRKPDVWTNTTLELKDYQSKPNPTLINAEGMDLYLTGDAPVPVAPSPLPRKPRNETVNGVERITLRSNVRMELYT